MEYTGYEDAIAKMINGKDYISMPLPDADSDFEKNPDKCRSFVCYDGSTFDDPDINDCSGQVETMMFNIYIFGLKRRANVLPYLSYVQKAVVGKRFDSYQIEANLIQDCRMDDKMPADIVLQVRLKRQCIWDDSDLPDADDYATDGDNSRNYNLKHPEFSE